jgi:hypothetical protein
VRRKRKRPQVERVPGTLPWEDDRPRRGYEDGASKDYPVGRWGSDLSDYRLPGSFENGKRR